MMKISKVAAIRNLKKLNKKKLGGGFKLASDSSSVHLKQRPNEEY